MKRRLDKEVEYILEEIGASEYHEIRWTGEMPRRAELIIERIRGMRGVLVFVEDDGVRFEKNYSRWGFNE